MIVQAEAIAKEEILSEGWVRFIDWRPQVDSTNSCARNSLNSVQPVVLPSLFVADSQTSGRGRSQRRWWSPKGCLMITLAVGGECLPENAEHWGQLALVSGVAVAETAAKFVDSDSIELKWPNDVFIDAKKCGGILIESGPSAGPPESRSNQQPTWLIGIGLNTAVDWDAAPPDVSGTATCLGSASRTDIATPTVLVELIKALHRWIGGWQRNDPQWLSAWRQRCMLTGRTIRAKPTLDRVVCGRCEGIDSAGRLILRTAAGVEFLRTGEIVSWD